MESKQLSSLLVQDNVVSLEKIEEAYQRQVLFGGRLGTNLLEIGAIDEATLLIYLSRTAGLPWADRELLGEVDWEAVELLDVDTIRAERLLPVRVDGTVVRALVTDALPTERLRELKARIGRPINQYITSEFRFDALLEKLFDLPLSARFRRLDERFPIEHSPRAGQSAELDDDELELDDHLGEPLTEPLTEIDTFEPLAERDDDDDDDGVVDVAEVETLMPGEARAAAARAPRAPTPVSVLQPVVIGGGGAAQPIAPRPRRPSTQAALDALWEAFTRTAATSESRDEILGHFARVACAIGDRCVLLIVTQDRLRGYLAESREPLALDVRTLSVRMREGSELALVADGGSYFRGPTDRGELQALYAKLQVPPPREALVLPVRLGRRVALLAVVDNGASPLPETPTLLFDSVYLASEALERAFLAHRQRSTDLPVVEDAPAAVAAVAAAAPPAAPPAAAPAAAAPPAAAPLDDDEDDGLGDEIPEVDIELEPLPGESAFDLLERPRTLNELVELEAIDEDGAGGDDLGARTDAGWHGATGGDEALAGRAEVARIDTLGPRGGRPAVSLELADDDDEEDDAKASTPPPPRAALDDSSHGLSRGGFASVAHSDVFVQQALSVALDPESEDLAIIDDVEPLELERRARRPPTPPIAELSPVEIEQWADRLDDRDRERAQQARELLSSPSLRAVAALMRRFPGRLRLDRFHYERDTPPPQRHSHVLAALVAQGELAEGALLSMLGSSSADERFYALLTLAEIRSEQVLDQLAELVFDKDPQVRSMAVRMARARRTHPVFERFVAALGQTVAAGDDDRRVELAVRALGQTRTIECLPALIPLIDHTNRRVADAARDACMALSLENPGSSARKWERWYGTPEVQGASRIQRLADAMVHREREVRELAAEELGEYPGMMLNYHPDAHRRERQRARQAFLDWAEAHPEQANRSASNASVLGHTSQRLGGVARGS